MKIRVDSSAAGRAARPRGLRRAHGRRRMTGTAREALRGIRGTAHRDGCRGAGARCSTRSDTTASTRSSSARCRHPFTSSRARRPTSRPAATEAEALAELRELASQNRAARPMIGLGYYDTFTPSVIARNVLENPSWYTAYTPYQPEISQGRLEALINFQTMVTDLTGLATANASMLDESTAVVEGMLVARRASEVGVERVRGGCRRVPADEGAAALRARGRGRHRTRRGRLRPTAATLPDGVSSACSCSTRAPRAVCGIRRASSTPRTSPAASPSSRPTCSRSRCCARRVRSARTSPSARPSASACRSASAARTPATWPCAQGLERQLPGRLVGVSQDAAGHPAYRLSLQTREQHIRREKATSNICTAQVLLAVMAAMYAVYHGPDGLRGDRDGRRPQGRGARGAAAFVRARAASRTPSSTRSAS